MTSGPAWRCSAASAAAGEPAAGTASTVSRFLLVEDPGPWGVDAVRDSRLPDRVKRHLLALRDQERVRPLLVRRCPPAVASGGVQVVLADVRTGTLTGTVLSEVTEVLDLDLATMPEVAGPLFLVCTHGRHDACCAVWGRPLAAALAEVDPARTWEVSHVGGDRFAPNVVVLPQGWYYGRLAPGDAPAFVERQLQGRVDVDHLRGRSAWPFPVQAAEVHLRLATGDDRADGVHLLGSVRDGDDRVVDLAAADGTWRVRVSPVRRPPARLTCRSTAESEVLEWVMTDITRLSGPERFDPATAG